MLKNVMFCIIVVIMFNLLSADVITPAEEKLLIQCLKENGLDSTDVNFLKDWSSDTEFKLSLVTDILAHPLHYPKFVDELDTNISHMNSAEMSYYVTTLIDSMNQKPIELLQPGFNSLKRDRFSNWEEAFNYVQSIWQQTDIYWQNTWKDLENKEIEQLRYFALSLHSEAEDSLKMHNCFTVKKINEYNLEMEEYVEIIRKVNFSEFKKAMDFFLTGMQQFIQIYNKKRFFINETFEVNSPWGRIAFGTEETDLYQGSYAFILDPGGDDVYQISMNTDFSTPFYALFDLEGNDTYTNDKVQELFSSFFGLGISKDFSGNDVYQGDDFMFSALFGYNLHEDFLGDDIYQGGLHSLAASSFGIAILEDKVGDDCYHITEFGQGFAGTMACGMLIDRGGDDCYWAGGKYLHAPLAPFDYRSMAQGFGFGLRPYMGGGVGVLYDGEGNDYYDGGVYSQAVAYWYALGIIIDKSGNDSYDAVYYPQGSGIHLAGGFLLDQEGEDHYYSKHGPGQGAAHDYAVGFLVDRAGDDAYSVEGGNGLALTNSVACFLDVSGNDRYERDNTRNYGAANISRDTGAIGLFLDTGGLDNYNSEISTNDSSWVISYYGIGKDTLFYKPKDKLEEIAETEAADIDTTASIEEIFAIASEWGVGSGTIRVAQAGDLLIKRDQETAQYIYENQLGTKSGLTYRAITKYANDSKYFDNYLLMALTHEDSLWNKNAIALLGESGDSIYIDTLTTFLDKNKYVNTVISTIGMIKSKQSVDILKKYIDEPSEKRRIIVARSLKNIDTIESRDLLYEMKNDPSFLIKTMVEILREKYKDK